MNEREHSGFRDLVSVIAVCGFILLAALTAFLWSGSAQNWLGALKELQPMGPSTEQGGKRLWDQPLLGRTWKSKRRSCSASKRLRR